MIYPATYNIRLLQNATWKGSFRVTQEKQAISSIAITNNVPTFTATCHGLVAGDRVVFTGGTTTHGLAVNTIYFVISDGLTGDAFKVSATEGGAAITLHGTPTGTFYIAKPVDLTGYTVDADIKSSDNTTSIGTFTPTITDEDGGAFELALTATQTRNFNVGAYVYDVSLTSGGGERYYWLKGAVTVELTYSRN